MEAARRRRRRAAQRRQVHPVQPHRRQARRHRRGPARASPGTARSVEAEWLGIPFLLVDTGGWLPAGSDLDAEGQPAGRAGRAERRPSCCSWSTPASGITEDDDAVATWLRRAGKPVLLGGQQGRQRPARGRPLGVPRPRPRRAPPRSPRCTAGAPATCSTRSSPGCRRPTAAGGRRRRATTTTTARTAAASPARRSPPWPSSGRPNVGKSTLFNRLIGDDRSVVHDLPGTTRDAIDTLVDTARRAHPRTSTRPACGARAASTTPPSTTRSCARCGRSTSADIALLVIDATEGVTAQDQRLAERIDAAGCPIVVLLNKWELLDDPDDRADVLGQMARKLHFVGDAPVLQDLRAHRQGRPQAAAGAGRRHRALPPPGPDPRGQRGHRRRPAGASPRPAGRGCSTPLQGATDPPTFTLFVNRELPPTYLRYLERKLRERFDLGSVPIKLRVRKRSS